MDQETIDGPAPAPRLSLRRLLGLHDHVFGAWTPYWAEPEADGTMTLLATRECAVCRRAQFRRENVPVPEDGFPHALHLGAAAPRRGGATEP